MFGTIVQSILGLDLALFQAVNSHHSTFFDIFFSILTNLGNGWVVIPILFGLVLWKVPKERRAWTLARVAIALTVSLLGNAVLKELIDRPRPPAYFASLAAAADGNRPYEVHLVGRELRNHSLPSGHTNTAFSAAMLACLIFGFRFWPLFLAAAAVAYSRIYLGVHFPLDTAAGALAGCALTFLVWRLTARRSIEKSEKR
jgi:undecaprenyl-diphosphatase